MASVKNWEAQAKTNSILASSLKSLEARVDDLSTLMEWCVWSSSALAASAEGRGVRAADAGGGCGGGY